MRLLHPVDSHRCLCGLSLWATQHTTRPDVWARHLAHIEAFQRQPPKHPPPKPERKPAE